MRVEVVVPQMRSLVIPRAKGGEKMKSRMRRRRL
jgi:hypothetical protein